MAAEQQCPLFGLGPVKMSKLSDAEAQALCAQLNIDCPEGTKPVPLLIAYKKQRAATERKARTQLDKTRAVKVLQAAARKKHQSTTPSSTALVPFATNGTFVERHALKLFVFNSYKMRLGREGLQEQWLALVSVMASLDVVVMSEVPAKAAHERTHLLVQMLKAQGKDDDEWSFCISDPAGPGEVQEVHILLAKQPLEILEHSTLHKADEVFLEYAPLVATLLDPRFSEPTRFVLTSVHFPPANRARDRDQQLKGFLSAYSRESEVRNNEPMTLKGAKDARRRPVVHVIGGDYNVYPGAVEGLDLTNLGFAKPLIGSQVATSSGRMSFDHFIVDSQTEQSFALQAEVLELSIPQNSRAKVIGLSDHHPILLCVKEQQQVGGKSKSVERNPSPLKEKITDDEPDDEPDDPPPAPPLPPPPPTPTPRNERPELDPASFTRPTLVWDTETAGLGKPGIVQLAYILYENGTVTEYDRILRLPPGVRIAKQAEAVHKITQARSDAGAPAEPELRAFHDLITRLMTCTPRGVMVGHNISFDCRAFNFTASELGLDLTPLEAGDMLCTMTASSKHSPLKTTNGRRKPFRLSELYEHLFGASPEWARLHNALDDVHVTALCYKKGSDRGWW